MSLLESVFNSAKARLFDNPLLTREQRSQVVVNLGGLLGDMGVASRHDAAGLQSILAQCLVATGIHDGTTIKTTNDVRITLEPLSPLDLQAAYGQIIVELEHAGDLSRPSREITSIIDRLSFHGN